MKKFVAKTLDAALIEAAQYFNCSLTQLEYEIFQNSSGGFLGLMKKDAIIIATKKEETIIQDSKPQTIQEDTIKTQENETIHNTPQPNHRESAKNIVDSNPQSFDTPHNTTNNFSSHHQENMQQRTRSDSLKTESIKNEFAKADTIKNEFAKSEFVKNDIAKNDIDSTLYDEQSHIPWQDSNIAPLESTQHLDMESACRQIQEELIALLNFLPINLDQIEVQPYDAHTISIIIDGLDAALLIGQKGYRYKSLSYLFFNWINTQYGYGVRLEIAQFLQNQEQMIRSYLIPIIESAKLTGKAQTKPLDGILTHIALKILRDELPNKYIVFRDTADGEKYITISDFLNSTNTNYRNNANGFGSSPKY